jgi:hypothetical protein
VRAYVSCVVAVTANITKATIDTKTSLLFIVNCHTTNMPIRVSWPIHASAADKGGIASNVVTAQGDPQDYLSSVVVRTVVYLSRVVVRAVDSPHELTQQYLQFQVCIMTPSLYNDSKSV